MNEIKKQSNKGLYYALAIHIVTIIFIAIFIGLSSLAAGGSVLSNTLGSAFFWIVIGGPIIIIPLILLEVVAPIMVVKKNKQDPQFTKQFLNWYFPSLIGLLAFILVIGYIFFE